MKHTISKILFGIGAKQRLQKKHFLYHVCNKFMAGYNNFNYSFETNGELLLISRLGEFKMKKVFDVGANIGDWSTIVASTFNDDVTVFSFEIVKPTFDILKSRLNLHSNIKCYDFGLAEVNDSVKIVFYGDGSGINSIITEQQIHDQKGSYINGYTRTGDSFCEEYQIDKIDFLKIDVEGAEHLVLQGLSHKLMGKKIDVIQFEYGMVNIYTKFLLKDYYELLGKDYLIGKLFPNGVYFSDYKPQNEDFVGPNYVAVLKERDDYIAALRV